MCYVVDMAYINRWATFAAGALIQSCAGLTYGWSIVAPSLKERFDFNEEQIGTVGALLNLGGYSAIIAGTVMDALSHRYLLGPRVVLWIGIMLLLTGFLGLHALTVGLLQPAFSTILLFAFVAGNAGTWFDTAVLVTNVRNFPNDRGTVVGVLKSFLGLSASIFASVYAAAFEPDAISFLLFMALAPASVVLTASVFVNVVPAEYHEADAVLIPVDPSGAAGADSIGGPPPAGGERAITEPLLHTSDALTARGGHHHHRHHHRHNHRRVCMSKQARFALCYLLVAVLAMYQMAATLYQGAHHLATFGRQLLTGIMVGMLSLLLLLPLYSGGCLPLPQGPNEAHNTLSRRPPGHRRRSCGQRPGMQRHAGRPGAAGTGAPASGAQAVSSGLQPACEAGSERDAKWVPDEWDDHDGGGHLGSGYDSSASSTVTDSEGVPPGAVADLGPLEAAQTMEWWALVLQCIVGIGTGLTLLNNLGSIVAALGGTHGGQIIFVSLFSVSNAAGRLLFGYVSERYLQSHGTPRTVFLVACSLAMLVVAVGGTQAAVEDLYALSILAGVAFGGHWSVVPSIVSDLFGLRRFASNYTTLQLAPALGALLLASMLAGHLYDRAAKQQGDGRFCKGPECYRGTWVVLSGLNILALLGSQWLLTRTRATYARMAVASKAAVEGYDSETA